ncbi:hypothetical protein FND36_05860 [Lachnospiraceae bacterium KGMB03038]|nr:hypothetical protein FND36_05860 [Lachnospiraceae bacterium KGMB03038]
MDGLECSEVYLSALETGYRFDSELYQKQYIVLNQFAKTHECTTFNKEASLVSKGIFNISASCYAETGIPFVRISNIDKMLISKENIVYIPEEEHAKHNKTRLVKGDIILSKTGGPAAAYVDMPECNVSQDTVAIKLKSTSKILSEYTVAYLNCVYGIAQMRKRFTGNVQMHLNLDDCKNNVIIPVMSMPFQKMIFGVFHRGLQLRNKSDRSFADCEKLLSDALGFSEDDIVGSNLTQKNYSDSFGKTGRLDAEYYSPKYDLLYELIMSRSKKVKTIHDIAMFNSRGRQPKYDKSGTLQVINSKHILENSLDYDGFEKTTSDAWDMYPTSRVIFGDILTYTTGANIGRTAVYLSTEKAVASNHVNILRINESYPIYIAVVMNSFVGRLQTEKLCGGSAQQELYPTQIDEFIVPFVDERIQIKITNTYKAAVEYKGESQKYFNLATRAIEIAIEQGEVAAHAWLNDKIPNREVVQ